MNNPSVDLEWNGLRAVGANALEVMKWFKTLGQEDEQSKIGFKNEIKKTLIVLDSLALNHLSSIIREEKTNFVLIFNAEDPALAQSTEIIPDGWLSLASLKENQGAYFNSELNSVEVRWNTYDKRQIPSLLSPNSSIQTQVAFTAAALAHVLHRELVGIKYA